MSWSSGAILSGVVREELTQKVVSAPWSEGGEGADTAGGSIPGRRNSRCKGPGAGGLLLCLRKIQYECSEVSKGTSGRSKVRACVCARVCMCACAAGTCTPVMRGHAHHAAVLRLTTQLVHSPRRGAQPQRVWESPGHRTPDHGPLSFPEQLTEPGQVA